MTIHDTAGQRREGFTIIEVLVVILLISLMAVLVVPQYLGRAEEAKRHVAVSQIAQLESHVQAFFWDCGRYPEQGEGLKALRNPPANLAEKWRGPYCKESLLIDPWGNPFVYIKPGQKNPNSFDIVSYAADGKPGGDGNNQDIYND